MLRPDEAKKDETKDETTDESRDAAEESFVGLLVEALGLAGVWVPLRADPFSDRAGDAGLALDPSLATHVLVVVLGLVLGGVDQRVSGP